LWTLQSPSICVGNFHVRKDYLLLFGSDVSGKLSMDCIWCLIAWSPQETELRRCCPAECGLRRERESRVASLLSINSHAHAHAQEKQMRHRLAVSKERRGALPDLLGRGFLARGK
jgi:hypothetical protein